MRIPVNKGIAAAKKRYDSYIHKTLSIETKPTFLSLILKWNDFALNSKFYLRIKGCAVGTICAPTYANIFMAEFEYKSIYPWLRITMKSVLTLQKLNWCFQKKQCDVAKLGEFFHIMW